MSINQNDAVVGDMDVCSHVFQGSNPLCLCVFPSRRGFSVYFYHQNNVFCNPPESLCTSGEVVFSTHLPEIMHHLSANSDLSSAADFGFQNNNSMPCWSASRDGSGDVGRWDAGPPSMAHVDNLADPNVEALNTKFGLSYSTSHAIETKLVKMLNDIQAPKTMYASILHWGREAYSQGYDFVP
jgi:hypothetical protein